jgi:hypothetical protein
MIAPSIDGNMTMTTTTSQPFTKSTLMTPKPSNSGQLYPSPLRSYLDGSNKKWRLLLLFRSQMVTLAAHRQLGLPHHSRQFYQPELFLKTNSSVV